jgi:hypothetical protein
VKTCADCDVALVDTLPHRPAVRDLATEPMEPICQIDDEAEGGQIMAVLANYGINAVLRHGVVQVLNGDAARALDLIQGFLEPGGEAPVAEDLVPTTDQTDVTTEDLVPVYEAPDQFLATTVESLLQHEGISATVQSRQMPMYDGLALMQNPVWGRVLVLERNAGRARDVINVFLRSVGEADAAAAASEPSCPGCSVTLRRGARFCDRCGAKVSEQ